MTQILDLIESLSFSTAHKVLPQKIKYKHTNESQSQLTLVSKSTGNAFEIWLCERVMANSVYVQADDKQLFAEKQCDSIVTYTPSGTPKCTNDESELIER